MDNTDLRGMPVLGLDIESTGISGDKNKPNNSDLLEIGLVFYDTDLSIKNKVSYKQLDEQEVSKWRIITHRNTKYLQGGFKAFEMHKDTLIPLHQQLDDKNKQEEIIMDLQAKNLTNSNVVLCNADSKSILDCIMKILLEEGWITAENHKAYVETGKGVETAITCAGKNVGTFDIKYLNEYIKNFGRTLRPRTRAFDPTVFFYQYGDQELPDLKTCMDRAKEWDSNFPDKKETAHTAVEDAMDIINLIHFVGLNGLYPYHLVKQLKAMNKCKLTIEEFDIKAETTLYTVETRDIKAYFVDGVTHADYTIIQKILDEELKKGDFIISYGGDISHSLRDFVDDFFKLSYTSVPTKQETIDAKKKQVTEQYLYENPTS